MVLRHDADHDAEFTTLLKRIHANGPNALNGNDFYRTIVHEIGHAMASRRQFAGDHETSGAAVRRIERCGVDLYSSPVRP